MVAKLKTLTPDLTPVHRFGAELRRLRIRAGMSQPQLASAVYTSKSTLSRAETGVRLLARDLAEACDTLVDAGGLLISAWEDAARADTADVDLALLPPAALVERNAPAPDGPQSQHVARRAHGRITTRVRYRCPVLPPRPPRGQCAWNPQLPDRCGIPGTSDADASSRAICWISLGVRLSLPPSVRRSVTRESIPARGDRRDVSSRRAVSCACRTGSSRSPPCV